MNKILKIISIMFLAISTTSAFSATRIARPRNRVVVSNDHAYLTVFDRVKQGFMAELALLRLKPDTAVWVKTAKNGSLDFTESFNILGDMIAEIIACKMTGNKPELDYEVNRLQKPEHWNYVFVKRYLQKMAQSGDGNYADVIETDLKREYSGHNKEIGRAKGDAIAYITGTKLGEMLNKYQSMLRYLLFGMTGDMSAKSNQTIRRDSPETPWLRNTYGSCLINAAMLFLSTSGELIAKLDQSTLRENSFPYLLREALNKIHSTTDRVDIEDDLYPKMAKSLESTAKALDDKDVANGKADAGDKTRQKLLEVAQMTGDLLEVPSQRAKAVRKISGGVPLMTQGSKYLLEMIAKNLKDELGYELKYSDVAIKVSNLEKENVRGVKAMILWKAWSDRWGSMDHYISLTRLSDGKWLYTNNDQQEVETFEEFKRKSGTESRGGGWTVVAILK